ncbi:tetratricopeptide repeat protein [Chitinophagaceae bacterium MMS25-I14]
MKQPIAIIAAVALGFGAQAQSLDEGIKMIKYERYESARKALSPLAASNAAANYYLGIAELGLDNTAAAKADFAKYPQDAANIAGMARVAFIEKNAAEGNRIAKTVADMAKKKEWEPLKYAADAVTYTDGGDYQQAISWYKAALAKNDNPDLHIALGDAFQKVQGGGGEAMNNYENVTGKDPRNSLAFSRIGALWYAAKNYKLALENYQKAKDADPSNPLPYRDLANAYFWVGKYDLAKQNIEQYLQLSDKSIEDQLQYANILYLSKDYPAAISKIQELINGGASKPYLYRILGYSQFETKDYNGALMNMNTFFSKQDPAKIIPSDYLYYGKILNQAGKTDSANYYFTKAVEADTSHNKSDTYRQIAEGFKDAKDYPRSAEWYGKLVQAYPESQALDYFWWGAMYYYSKNYQGAAKAFEQMETKYPDQPSATYWRGRVAAASDAEAKEGTAVPFYTKWLEKVGGNSDKKSDLMQAYQYLALYYYNKNDKANAQTYLDKITAIDPNDAFAKQIKDAMSRPAGGAKSTPAKAKK